MITVPVDQYLKDLASFTWTFLHRRFATADLNPTLIKADPALLYSISITPISGMAGELFVKFHNTSVAPVGGSTPVVKTVKIITNANPVPVIQEFSSPILFDRGLAYTVTKGILDDNTTVCVANDAIIEIGYR